MPDELVQVMSGVVYCHCQNGEPLHKKFGAARKAVNENPDRAVEIYCPTEQESVFRQLAMPIYGGRTNVKIVCK